MEQISIVLKVKNGDEFSIAKDMRDYATKKFQKNLVGKVGVHIKTLKKFGKGEKK